MFATPRSIPSGHTPAIAATLVVALALPVFFAAGWRIESWGIAAGLWVVYQAVGAWLDKVQFGGDNLAAAGIVAFGRMTRAVVLMAVLIAVAVSNAGLGLPAAVVYGIAFTVELAGSLIAYFVGGVGGR